MIANNDCAHRVTNNPNDSESLIHSFHALHRAVHILRDVSSISDSLSVSIEPEFMSASLSVLNCTTNEQHQQSEGRTPTTLEATKQLHLTCHSGSDPTSMPGGENSIDIFYFCDRMIFFQNPDIHIQNDDEVTMVLISSTLLFNFSVICNLYGMQQSDSKRTLLLQRACKVYFMVIGMLNHIIRTSPVTPSFIYSNNGVLHQVGNIDLLLTFTYNNLGLTFYKLCMYAEYNECMVKLDEVVGNRNCILELIRPACFIGIIEEIKLNAIYWKSFFPSPVALAA